MPHPNFMRDHILLTSLALAAMSFSAVARSVAYASEPIDYLTRVKPILAERCYACHGALKQESGLRLDTAAMVIQGGASGPGIALGDADASLLVQRIEASEATERMPAEGRPLEPAQIAILRAWIDQNAPAPAKEAPERNPRDHWAFRPISKPPVPNVQNAAWLKNALDAFVSQKHEQAGLTPQVAATRELLVRRLYIDLIGLPPSEGEVAQIDADNGHDWYERLARRLLDDPRHGERWARHWMDIWRYSDWWGLGDQLRNSHPHIWHWRDWIVESLNSNRPYDEMVCLMFAADELYPNDLDKLRATGFLARNWALFGRDLWMEETVEHVSKAFLGLTMNCAKCHDHKYDPIEQVDFYRLRAFFEPYHVRLDMVPGESDLARDAIPRAFDGAIDAPTYRYERGQESQPDKSVIIKPGVPEMLALEELKIESVSLPREAWQPERRPWVVESYVSAAQANVAAREVALAAAMENDEPAECLRVGELALLSARAELTSVKCRTEAVRAAWARADDANNNVSLAEDEQRLRLEAVRAERTAAVAKARHVVAEVELRRHRAAEDAKEAVGKELATAREVLEKAEELAASEITAADKFTPLIGAKWTPTRFLSSQADDPTIEFPPQSTGRRAALARWITDPRNPLTARVAVNHIWARHMGAPLVATVFDFGRKGSPPTHPELLDWLAAEFIERGWDMKHLHYLIVTSATYRMSSSIAGREKNIAMDPDNKHLWRRPAIRLEAEVVRDSILSLAGKLDTSRGGPPILPAAQADSLRRSLYFFHSNNERNVFLATFDGAGVKECYRREQSVLPQQALALSNSALVHDAACEIACRLSPSSASTRADDRNFLRRAFRLVLGVPANEQEISMCERALQKWRKLSSDSADGGDGAARQQLIWALVNHNDFVTLR